MIQALILMFALSGVPDGGYLIPAHPCLVEADCDPGFLCLQRGTWNPGQVRDLVCTPGCNPAKPRCPAGNVCEEWMRGQPRCKDGSGHFTSP